MLVRWGWNVGTDWTDWLYVLHGTLVSIVRKVSMDCMEC
jgi:hypothetical protein